MRRISRYVGALLSSALCLPSPLQATETITYTYDALGRVTGVSSTGTINAGQSVSTTFDPAGNRTNYSVTGVPTISIGNAVATEGVTLTFTVTRSSSTGSATVNYSTAPGTAVSPGDFTTKSGTLTFDPGMLTQNISVATTNDSALESTETMTVTLSSPSAGWSVSPAVGTGTINDNDFATISIANNSPSVTEGGNLAFTITRSGVTSNAVTARYDTSNGSAIAGTDYTALINGTVSFAAGVTSQTVNVPTTNDTLPEPSETLNLTLSSPSSGATIGVATRTGTIVDNDTAIISIGDTYITEGGVLAFTVTRSGVTTTTASANYATASGTAISGTDFTANTGMVTFTPGQTSKTVSVVTINDAVSENNENMTVALTSPSSGAALGTAVGTGIIIDDDSSVFSIGDAIITEGGTLSFTVSRSGLTTNATSVSFATSSGSATSGSDFDANSGTINFAAGVTSRLVNVSTVDDTTLEPDETMSVTLSGAFTNDAVGEGTILDNDNGLAMISIGNASATEGGTLSFTVTRSGNTTNAVSAQYDTSSWTAISNSDYVSTHSHVYFAAGETSKTVTVDTKQDTIVEGNETFRVNVANPSAGADVDYISGEGTIFDDDS
jgi:YD repeat-containing protein